MSDDYEKLVADLRTQRDELVEMLEKATENSDCLWCCMPVGKPHLIDCELAALLKLVKDRDVTEREKCTWTEDETHWCWRHSCGWAWYFRDGGPTQVQFCPWCGKPVKAVEAKGQ